MSEALSRQKKALGKGAPCINTVIDYFLDLHNQVIIETFKKGGGMFFNSLIAKGLSLIFLGLVLKEINHVFVEEFQRVVRIAYILAFIGGGIYLLEHFIKLLK